MKTIGKGLVRWLSSYGLCCFLLIGLFLLTALGTWAQRTEGLHAAQKRFFDSLYVLESFSFGSSGFKLVVPLPGGVTLMTLLALNLLVGGFIRVGVTKGAAICLGGMLVAVGWVMFLPSVGGLYTNMALRFSLPTVFLIVALRMGTFRTLRQAGVLGIHSGIAILLAAGLVKLMVANEGAVTLYEGEEATHYTDYYKWELAVREIVLGETPEETTHGDEWVVSGDHFDDLGEGEISVMSATDLPFDVHLSNFEINARVLPKGPNWSSAHPVIDGYGVMPMKPDKEGERNMAVAYVDVVPKGAAKGVQGKQAILWSVERAPFAFQWDERWFAVALQKARYPLPFAVQLTRFTKEDHPRTNIASVFASDILRKDLDGDREIPVHIAMNEPLREDGTVLFQSKWGPSGAKPGTPIFSVFAVVRNPSDRWPEYSCWVIALGMLLAFGAQMARFLKRSQSSRDALESGDANPAGATS